jgi:hypothetical protein
MAGWNFAGTRSTDFEDLSPEAGTGTVLRGLGRSVSRIIGQSGRT